MIKCDQFGLPLRPPVTHLCGSVYWLPARCSPFHSAHDCARVLRSHFPRSRSLFLALIFFPDAHRFAPFFFFLHTCEFGFGTRREFLHAGQEGPWWSRYSRSTRPPPPFSSPSPLAVIGWHQGTQQQAVRVCPGLGWDGRRGEKGVFGGGSPSLSARKPDVACCCFSEQARLPANRAPRGRGRAGPKRACSSLATAPLQLLLRGGRGSRHSPPAVCDLIGPLSAQQGG